MAPDLSDHHVGASRAVATRWRLAPWIVLLAGLGATILAAQARHMSVESTNLDTVAAAEDHFGDIAADVERGLGAEQTRIEALALAFGGFLDGAGVVTAESVAGFADSVGLATRLAPAEALTVDTRDGSGDATRLFDAIGTELDPAALEMGDESRERLAQARDEATRSQGPALVADLNSPASSASSVSVGTTAMVYPAVPVDLGDGRSTTATVTVWARADEFLGTAFDAAHHIDVALQPARGGTVIGGTGSSTDDRDHVPEASGDSGPFHMSRTFDIAGEPFVLEVTAEPDFVPPAPGNRGTYIVMVVGIALSIALFLVVVRLTSMLAHRAGAIAQLADSNARLTAGFDESPISMAELGLDGEIRAANRALCRQLQSSSGELLGRHLVDVVHPEDRALHLDTVASLTGDFRRNAQVEVRYVGAGGSPIWVVESLTSVPDPDGKPAYLLLQAQDVTARRRAEATLSRRALHDELTGLPNRALLMDRLRQELGRCERTGSRLALLFIDLDRFKVINDSLGHSAGDELLTAVAQRISQSCRDVDTVARFGGDEFVVLCEVHDGKVGDSKVGDSDVDDIVARVVDGLVEPIPVAGGRIRVTVSIGVSVSGGPDGYDTPETMLRDADAAMYRAKDAGRNRTVTFDERMRAAAVDRLELETALRRAGDGGEFELLYQPLIDASGRLIAGVEALIRWRHPLRGLLTPDVFLRIASEMGLIESIDRFAVREACAQLARWTAAHETAESLHMAVNSSPATFVAPDFVDFVAGVMDRYRIENGRLWIEVTESALLDNTDAAIAAMNGLRELGVRIAIDDFGTGYSSLSYLTRFPFDVLKLDRSFVEAERHDQPQAAILAAVADMARAIGTPIVVEGVEHPSQLGLVASLKADYIQGFLFDRPRAAEEIERRYLITDARADSVENSGPDLVAEAG